MVPISVREVLLRVGLAVKVEGVWVREDVCVSVRGLVGGDYAFASFYGLFKTRGGG
jgi:hypothetical protein